MRKPTIIRFASENALMPEVTFEVGAVGITMAMPVDWMVRGFSGAVERFEVAAARPRLQGGRAKKNEAPRRRPVGRLTTASERYGARAAPHPLLERACRQPPRAETARAPTYLDAPQARLLWFG